MDQITCHSYQPEFEYAWDELIDQSCNGTFIHKRGFLEYNGHSFSEISLMFFYNDTLLAVLPLEESGDNAISHRGLTYAGLIFRKGLKQKDIHAILERALNHLKEKGKKVVFINTVPSFFCSESQDDYHQCLLNFGAKSLHSRSFYFTSLPFKIQDRGKKWGKRKAEKNQVQVKESSDLDQFWHQVLIPCLQERHQGKPVHHLDEIRLLQSRFSNHISLWVAKKDKHILAGSLIFKIKNVIHCQYVASTAKGRELRALDLLFADFIEGLFADQTGISLGTAVQPTTGKPDFGLIRWKESLGGKAIQVPSFRIDLIS